MLANRLKILRENRGLTQTQVAEQLQISRVNYNRYENGEREPDNATLSRLADFFGVSVDYLLGRTDNPTATVEQKQEQKKPKDLQKFLDQQEIMFDGVPLTEDDKEKIRKALELIFWDAKQKNKREKS